MSSPELVMTRYGRPAGQALARTIAQAKSASPLEPVTVVVASNFAGLVARRTLGAGLVGGQGVANVSFLTPFRLAELLAVGQLRGRQPLTNPILGAAVRQALASDPGHFARVRDHQATEQAVAAAVGELANLTPERLDAMAGLGGFVAGVVGLHRAVMSRLGDFHDEAAVARAAADRPDLSRALGALGHLIWYLPAAMTGPLAELMTTALAATSSTVIAGRSGAPDADTEVDRALERVGLGAIGITDPSQQREPLAAHVVSVTDADEEVRHVVRCILELGEQGVAFDRIGVFHPTPDPYVRILEQHFAAAELAANGPSRRRLADSVSGRTLLGALALPGERWRRDRVIALISGGPLRHRDQPVRPSAWDTISRVAGIVMDRRDWLAKLDAHRHRLTARRDRAAEQRQQRWVESIDRDLGDTEALADFSTELFDRVQAVATAESWLGRSQAAAELLVHLLGPAHQHSSWPEAEQVAFEQVEAAIERLGALDPLDPEPSLDVFTRALGAELAISRNRNGRFGHGVVYGPLSTAAGHDLDAVFILGCTEGRLPAPRREDALLPDGARAVGGLPLRLEQLHEQHRQFLAALAAAPRERRWLTFPRGDLRSNRRARPSRWLLASASELAGRRLHGTDFDDQTPTGVTELASHASAIADTAHPVSADERDLGQVLAHVGRRGDVIEHPAAAAERAGLLLQRARAGSEFTEFDGNLAGAAIESAGSEPWSPSRLEAWAACGFRYYLSYVLGLTDRDDPELIVELSALDRGSAMHAILERFLTEVVAQAAPAPGERWSPEWRARAEQIAHEVFEDYERRGRTGRALTWRIQRNELMATIDEFLDADAQHRAERLAVPARFEVPFGLRGAPPVRVEIGAERSLSFRGVIDRIDTAPDGRMIVSDYKTGSGNRYKKLASEPDPTTGGTLLQLGLYAEAAAQLLGAESVDTRYWVVDPRADYERFGYEWTREHRDRLGQVVATIVEGIETGVFMAAPGEWQSFRNTYEQCTFCEFDSVCPRDRAEHAADKAEAPELEVRDRLVLDDSGAEQ